MNYWINAQYEIIPKSLNPLIKQIKVKKRIMNYEL